MWLNLTIVRHFSCSKIFRFPTITHSSRLDATNFDVLSSVEKKIRNKTNVATWTDTFDIICENEVTSSMQIIWKCVKILFKVSVKQKTIQIRLKSPRNLKFPEKNRIRIFNIPMRFSPPHNKHVLLHVHSCVSQIAE